MLSWGSEEVTWEKFKMSYIYTYKPLDLIVICERSVFLFRFVVDFVVYMVTQPLALLLQGGSSVSSCFRIEPLCASRHVCLSSGWQHWPEFSQKVSGKSTPFRPWKKLQVLHFSVSKNVVVIGLFCWIFPMKYPIMHTSKKSVALDQLMSSFSIK